MATRNTRTRPLDNNKPLDIIRFVDDLDAKSNDDGGLGGRELEQTIEALEKKKDDVRLCHLVLETLLCRPVRACWCTLLVGL